VTALIVCLMPGKIVQDLAMAQLCVYAWNTKETSMTRPLSASLEDERKVRVLLIKKIKYKPLFYHLFFKNVLWYLQIMFCKLPLIKWKLK
jgi:hypothetical protein